MPQTSTTILSSKDHKADVTGTDISFNATDRAGETITVDQKYVQNNLGNLVKDTDLSKFIL